MCARLVSKQLSTTWGPRTKVPKGYGLSSLSLLTVVGSGFQEVLDKLLTMLAEQEQTSPKHREHNNGGGQHAQMETETGNKRGKYNP